MTALLHSHPHDLGSGAAATAMLHGVTARTRGAWRTAHTAVQALTRQPVTTADASLFRGVPAIAYALSAAGHPAYEAPLVQLDTAVATLTRQRLLTAHRRIDRGEVPRTREFDLISGLAGLGAYLLHRGHHSPLLHEVLGYLVRLLEEPVTVAGRPVPGWWSADAPSTRPASHGHANLGLAHGLAGPIALLALTARAGHTVPGQLQALASACQVLTHRRLEPPGHAPGWPETLTLDEWEQHRPHQRLPGRPSWCYGTPGIARALQLAALACHDPQQQRLAETALWDCLDDERQLSLLSEDSVCHGWAGLLLTAHLTATDAPENPQHRLAELTNRLTAGARSQPAVPPGLLTGSDGVLLVQRTLETADPVDPTWATCLLLT
ncbi:lanthionine synthetase C family protein [Streptomyces sp. NPDC097617]|uniref:lanthionine synthetase C family protein n=1 Tax=Streptomyces sp. NPDC097617 TaxID=3366091 RepID=UPI0037F99329